MWVTSWPASKGKEEEWVTIAMLKGERVQILAQEDQRSRAACSRRSSGNNASVVTGLFIAISHCMQGL